MKTLPLQSHFVLLVGLLAMGYQPSTANAQGTEFTYQGSLHSNGIPVSGVYDLRFALFDAPTGGTQQGLTLDNDATVVSNGLFTATLDFDDQFPGDYRWLEIGVRSNGVGAHTLLTPRQLLTRSPYAVFANKAGNLTGSLPASQISGTIASAQISASVVTNGSSGVVLTGTFSGTGSGLTGISPTNLLPAETEFNISPFEFQDLSGYTRAIPDLGAVKLTTISGTPADMTYKNSNVALDFQTRSNQFPTTYSFTNNSGTPLKGAAYLTLYAHIQNSNPTNYLRIGPVTVTIGP